MKVQLNQVEYSKYEPDRQIIQVALVACLAGIPLTVSLVRLDGYGPVYLQTLTPGTTAVTVQFDLTALAPDGINYIRQGQYRIEVQQGATLAVSRNFPISILSVDVFQKTYLFGVQLFASDLLFPVAQPLNITGTRVTYVDEGMLKGANLLQYSSTAQTLSWAGGAPVPVLQNGELQYLRLLSLLQDAYLEIRVDPDQLPPIDQTDMLLIDNLRLGETDLRRYLIQAYDWVQKALQMQLETTIVITDPVLFTGFYDEIAQPQVYERLNDTYLPIVSPLAKPLRKVISLAGFYGGQQMMTIPTNWFSIDEAGAVLDLLPNTQAITTLVYGSMYGWPGISHWKATQAFWHYSLISGLRSLNHQRGTLTEAIGKKAALLALQDIGTAISGGRTSSQAQREGVSSSFSYGQGGAYGDKILMLDTWLKDNMPKLKQYFGGMTMVVL